MRILFLSLTLALLAGCSNWGFPGVYRINVEQGNIVTQEMVDQLKPGMTRRQVRYILGTPLLEHTFDRDRWDYVYMVRNGTRTVDENRLSVFFEGDELVSYRGSLVPDGEVTQASFAAAEAERQEASDVEEREAAAPLTLD